MLGKELHLNGYDEYDKLFEFIKDNINRTSGNEAKIISRESLEKLSKDLIISYCAQNRSNLNSVVSKKVIRLIEGWCEEYKQQRNELLNERNINSVVKKYLSDIMICDAAALCELTYVFDPNRTGKDEVFHTYSKNWKPYIVKENKIKLSKQGLGFFSDDINSDNDMEEKIMTMDENFSFFDRIGLGTFKNDIFKEFKKRMVRERTGFFSMLYYRSVNMGQEKKYQLAYVPAGTTFNYKEHKGDLIADCLLANAGQALFGLSPQHTLAIQNAKILDRICRRNNYDLYFFGHSLGGGIAIACALATNREAIVFNNAGLNRIRNLVHGTYWRKDDNKIKRIFTESDFLSTEKENKNWIKYINLAFVPINGGWSPQDIGTKIFLGKGGHGIADICKKLKLSTIGSKVQIKDNKI